MAPLVNRRREPDAEPVLARPAGTRGTPNGRTAPCMCLPGPLAFEARRGLGPGTSLAGLRAYRAAERGVYVSPTRNGAGPNVASESRPNSDDIAPDRTHGAPGLLDGVGGKCIGQLGRCIVHRARVRGVRLLPQSVQELDTIVPARGDNLCTAEFQRYWNRPWMALGPAVLRPTCDSHGHTLSGSAQCGAGMTK
jgi:hypothetical protein